MRLNLPSNQVSFRGCTMFLSKEAIAKQLVHEFLNFNILALAPGTSVDLDYGTLLSSSLKEDIGLAIESAEARLRSYLITDALPPPEQQQFTELFDLLIDYKKAAHKKNNPFAAQAQIRIEQPHPSAWPIFAPLLIESTTGQVAYASQNDLVEHLQSTHTAFSFNKNCRLEETGLYLAVQTNNHEMVAAFLCPQFYGYQLNSTDFKKLLSLTQDEKTRIALFQHSNSLIEWIIADADLQKECVLNSSELASLWSFLSIKQRKQFINQTAPALWLNLLDTDLSKQKINQLLDADFELLHNKLLNNTSMKSPEHLIKSLVFISPQKQFNYLIKQSKNNALIQTQTPNWYLLLGALGYHLNKKGVFTCTRYFLPEPSRTVHHQFVKALIQLPLDAEIIIQALEQIQLFIEHPERKNEYQQFLKQITRHALEKEAETNFFIINWLNKLLRYLNIKPQSPLHPYIDNLATCISNNQSGSSISNEQPQWLPSAKDMKQYNEALSALSDANIALFWSKISAQNKKEIIEEPLRLNALLRLLAQYKVTPLAFFELLDKDSLLFFNTTKGLRQLVLNTPSFDKEHDMPRFAALLQRQGITLTHIPDIVCLLLDEEEVFQSLLPLFPYKSKNYDDLLAQEHILKALPKELEKEHVERFLAVYCPDAHHFSELMLSINNSNSSLVHQLWRVISASRWEQWYGGLEHANEWAQTLPHLELGDRLEFFEKLTSDGKLTAEEFCDFLLQKNLAVFDTLWNKIPPAQWATWLSDNRKLPQTTLSLLNTCPFPLRITLFQAMLSMSSNDLAALCIDSNITLEQHYHSQVVQIMRTASTVSEAKAKLHKLKQDQHLELNNKIDELISAMQKLTALVIKLKEINPESTNTLFGFFSTNPFAKPLTHINNIITEINQSALALSTNPLQQIIKKEANDARILAAINQVKQALTDSLEHLEPNCETQQQLDEKKDNICNIVHILKLESAKSDTLSVSELNATCSHSC